MESAALGGGAASFLGEFSKKVGVLLALLEGKDDRSKPNVCTGVVIRGLGDRREGVLAGVIDQIASFQIVAGAVRASVQGDQILVCACDDNREDVFA
jgi:hypothetical protein